MSGKCLQHGFCPEVLCGAGRRVTETRAESGRHILNSLPSSFNGWPVRLLTRSFPNSRRALLSPRIRYEDVLMGGAPNSIEYTVQPADDALCPDDVDFALRYSVIFQSAPMLAPRRSGAR